MKKFVPGLIAFSILVLTAPAHADATFSSISNNAIDSVDTLPGLISGGSYLLGLVLGIMGILKLKAHVENPHQNFLKEAVARFGAGGALFALPMVYTATQGTIDGGNIMDGITGVIQETGADMAVNGGAGGGTDINAILDNIVASLADTPSLMTGVAYLLALMFGVAGILQLKDHVLNPENVPLRSGVIKLLAAGSLFGLGAIFSAMWLTISNGDGGGLGNLAGSMGISNEANGAACEAGDGSIGAVMCNMFNSTTMFPIFLKACSYLFGVVLGIWGILKIKDHVINPQQTPVWEGVARMVAGGAMFGLPYVVTAVFTSLGFGIDNHHNTNGGPIDGTTGAGLDHMLALFMTSIFGPTDVILTFFGYVAGIILVMIGITRLLKSAQEGPRGPGGVGTMMTFVAGGALLSFSPMVAAFTVSLFDGSGGVTTAIPKLQYTAGLGDPEIQHIQAVVSAMIQFVLLLGLVSFLRGIFIIRSVAEGNHQASMMAGVTHMVGGALAVNLGPFINAVESTLGLAQYGLGFS